MAISTLAASDTRIGAVLVMISVMGQRHFVPVVNGRTAFGAVKNFESADGGMYSSIRFYAGE